MAPIKFEEELREKLEERTIATSNDSWSRLSERLDEESGSKRPRLFWWIGIAASLLLMLSIAVQFLNKNTVEEKMPQMVEEPVEPETMRNRNIQEKSEELPVKLVDKPIIVSKAYSAPQKSETIQKGTSPAQIESRLAQSNDVVREPQDIVGVQKNLKSTELDVIVTEQRLAVATKKLNIASVDGLDKEVDSLLKMANMELMRQKFEQNTIKTVNADALLESVQDDMGQSFRTKVFEALKESYKTIRTKVAERNN